MNKNLRIKESAVVGSKLNKCYMILLLRGIFRPLLPPDDYLVFQFFTYVCATLAGNIFYILFYFKFYRLRLRSMLAVGVVS